MTRKHRDFADERKIAIEPKFLVATMFVLYLGLVLFFYPTIGHVIFIANALPVLTTAILYGMRRALAMFAFCYLFSDIVLLLVLSGQSLSHVVAVQTSPEALLGAGTGLVVTILVGRLSDMNKQIRTLHRKVLQLSRIDSLTQLYNRGIMTEFLIQEIKRAQRAYHEDTISGNIALSVAMIDVDYFKDVNDRYGHLVGDEVLRIVGKILSSPEALRASDIRGRYGGEEFLVILPQTSSKNAEKSITRLREIIGNHSFAAETEQSISITVSCGIAEMAGAGDTVESLLKRADEALYRAKNMGRNRVEVY